MPVALKAAVQFVWRRRGATRIAAVTLALAIAANVLVFALVRSILFAPEPYRSPEELFQFIPANHMAESPFEQGDLEALAQIPGVAFVAGCRGPDLPTGRTHPALLGAATAVSEDFFRLLGARPIMGRTLEPTDFAPGAESAVISYELWQALAGPSEVVGQRIALNRQSFIVVGVMPPAFAPPCFDANVRRQAWIPLSATDSNTSRTGLSVLARVSPIEALDLVQAQVDGNGLGRAAGTSQASYAGMFLQPLGHERQQQARAGLLLLQSLGVCLVLIVGANFGNLFLLDASRREAELLTRAFLGASQWRIVRQLLLESSIIASVGAAAGAGLSLILGSVVRALAAPVLPRGVLYQVGWVDVLVCTVGGVVIIMIVASVSALLAVRRAWRWGVRSESQFTPGRSVRRFQYGLVAFQVTLSVVLAVVAGVVGVSYLKVVTLEQGLEARGVVTSALHLRPDAPADVSRTAQLRLADELRRFDDTVDVAFADTPPFAGGSNWRVAVDHVEPPAPRSLSATVRKVTPNYFDVLRIPLSAGRTTAADPGGDVPEAVASSAFARLFGGDERVLGRVVRVAGTMDHQSAFVARFGHYYYRIVGIAADVSTTWIWKPEGPTLYVDLDRRGTTALSVVVRTRNEPAMIERLPRVSRQIAADAPEVLAEGLDTIVWRSEAERRVYVAVAATLALVAVFVAALGAYTAMGRMVALRTREFAIRMSLGAAPRRVQADVLWTALVPVTIGIAAGGVATFWSAGFAESLRQASVIVDIIMRTAPSVGTTMVIVAVAVFLLSACACWLPARRAASLNPSVLMNNT